MCMLVIRIFTVQKLTECVYTRIVICMAGNDVLELRIIDQNKVPAITSTLSPLPIPQIVVTETRDPTLLKNRRHHVSSSSNTTDTVTVVTIPMKASRQFSVQSGGIINIGTGNYLRFHRARRLALWCCIYDGSNNAENYWRSLNNVFNKAYELTGHIVN